MVHDVMNNNRDSNIIDVSSVKVGGAESIRRKMDAICYPGHQTFLPEDDPLGTFTDSVDHFNRQLPKTWKPRTHQQYMNNAAEIALQPTKSSKQKKQKELGAKGPPAFHKLPTYFNTVDNCINDFMHLLYNIILLVFQYIIRQNVSKGRLKDFYEEDRYLDFVKKIKNDGSNCVPGTQALWQASNARLKEIISEKYARRVPGSDPGQLDCPFEFGKSGQPSLAIDGTAQWIEMIGPIGIYYIQRTDIHQKYKDAFSDLLWWMYKLRQRLMFKDMLQEIHEKKNYSYFYWGQVVLSRLEFLMPKHFCRLTLHLMQHFTYMLRLTGPVHATWMMVYERWVKVAKAGLHSTKGPGEGVMQSILALEWLYRNQLTTQEHLNELLTPPKSWLTTTRHVQLLGTRKATNLHFDLAITSDYRLLHRFLLDNDPIWKIINTEFKFTHKKTWSNGKDIIYNWVPSEQSLIRIQSMLKNEEAIELTIPEIQRMQRDGPGRVYSYNRFSVNGVIFCTNRKEGNRGRGTRKYIYYRDPDHLLSHKKCVARVEGIYEIASSTLLKASNHYRVLRILNYEYIKEREGVLDLPHVEPVAPNDNLIDYMPVIPVDEVFACNIGLWPSMKHTIRKYRVVQMDPFHQENY